MAREKHRSQLDAINTINVTPLLDTAFMLLIVFMISAPLLEYGVDVSPPEMNAEKIPEDNSRVITLNKRGEIVFNKNTLSKSEFMKELDGIRDKKAAILLRADGSRPYSEVMDVMKIVRAAGFKNISLITQAESK